jgi:hypothetical protein
MGVAFSPSCLPLLVVSPLRARHARPHAHAHHPSSRKLRAQHTQGGTGVRGGVVQGVSHGEKECGLIKKREKRETVRGVKGGQQTKSRLFFFSALSRCHTLPHSHTTPQPCPSSPGSCITC